MKKKLSGIGILFMLLLKHPPIQEIADLSRLIFLQDVPAKTLWRSLNEFFNN